MLMGFKKCWICGTEGISKAKESNIEKTLTADDFAITNKNYGITGTIYHCSKCGFMQCDDLHDVIAYYEKLEDVEYENTREPRSLQERKILELVKKFKSTGKLLDIGAGTGILVKEANDMGYEAIGIEPSKWLQLQASKLGLPVFLGAFPHPDIAQKFEIITLVDVIEHVPNPVQFLLNVRKFLQYDGIGVLVVPDTNSFIRRVFGWRWWHFRVAHIGYFNKENLLLALDKTGFRVINICRPSWYFTIGYLFKRILKYIPKYNGKLHFWFESMCFKDLTIPINLHDSLMVIFKYK